MRNELSLRHAFKYTCFLSSGEKFVHQIILGINENVNVEVDLPIFDVLIKRNGVPTNLFVVYFTSIHREQVIMYL